MEELLRRWKVSRDFLPIGFLERCKGISLRGLRVRWGDGYKGGGNLREVARVRFCNGDLGWGKRCWGR